MLIGEYNAKLTDNNRAALPKNFRKELSDQLILTRGYEGCIIVVDLPRWQGLVDQIERRPFINTDVRNTKRFLIGGAQEAKLDTQGRFVVPEMLMRYAKLLDDLVFVGIQEWVELWDLKIWEEKISDLANTASDIGDRLSNLEKLSE